MLELVLTEEQAKFVAQANSPIAVRDPQGNWLGRIDPREAAIVAEVLSRRGKPQQKGIPGHKVQEHLRALQAEWDRLGGFDRDYMHRFLEKLRAEDEQ
jgi:hypothetical protein